MKRQTELCNKIMTNRLLVTCSSLGSHRALQLMRRSSIAIATLISIAASSEFANAQEAVSSTSGSGTTSTSSSGASSAGSTTELSAGSTTASSPGAVSNAPSAATSVQGGPGGVGVFSPTPIKLYLNIFGGYDDDLN